MSLFRASALVAALFLILPSCKTSTEQSFSTSAGAESSALQSGPAQVSAWLFQEDFKDLKITRKKPAAPYTAYRWYSREDTNVNGELQKYRSYLFNDAQTTTGADAVVCKGASTDKDHCASDLWTMRVVDDDSASDKKALQLRAIRDKATGIIYSGRIETKRFAEFKPSATKGIPRLASSISTSGSICGRCSRKFRTEASLPSGRKSMTAASGTIGGALIRSCIIR